MRILGGRFRGRPLVAPSGLSTRPTSARARGALFEIVRERLEDAFVADLCAGTGSLGLEALSRGARRVDFYESQRAPLAALRKNIEALAAGDRTRILHGALPDAIGVGEPYDLALVDPPWRQGLELGIAARLVAKQRLGPESLLVIESPRTDPLDAAPFAALGLALADQRTYGDTELRFFTTDRRPS